MKRALLDTQQGLPMPRFEAVANVAETSGTWGFCTRYNGVHDLPTPYLEPLRASAMTAPGGAKLSLPSFPMGRVPRAARTVVRFGAFELDLRAGELRKRGVKIRLQDKPFQMLDALLEQPGELVTRDELCRRLWPSDTFVDFDGSLNTAAGKLRESLGDSAENPRFVETLPRRGYRFIAPVEKGSPAPRLVTKAETTPPVAGKTEATQKRVSEASAADEKSIAVLPLENLSSDGEQEYFCDGMTEELINALTQIGELRVVARTSAFAFKGAHRDIRQIGIELGVAMVVEGSVRKAGDRLRVTVQLIQAATGYHVWSQRYDRKLTDVFEIQDEISQSIVDALEIKLVGRRKRPLVSKSTSDLDAYDLHLRGLNRWHKQTNEDMMLACDYFEQAIAKDPNCAPSYVGLSDCHRLQGWWGAAPPREAMRKAGDAALKAVEIDPNLGAAHRVLAGVKGHSWDDWPGAKREFEKALELNPTDAITHASYGFVLLFPMGTPEGGIERLRAARNLDPLSAFHTACLGWALYMGRRFNEAIEIADEAEAIDSKMLLAQLVKGWSLEQKGQLDSALECFERARDLGPLPPVLGSLAHCHARCGEVKQAQGLLAKLESASEQRYVPLIDIAVGYAGLDDRARTLKWLERAYEDRTLRLSTIRLDPRFDPLRKEPRFTTVLARMGLKATSQA